MSIYRSRPPRDKREGVALAAIVAKESSQGTWSGSGGGVGVGTGGVGVFSASMSGESSSQTHRAAQLAAPKSSGRESFYANSAVMVGAFIVAFVVLLVVGGKARNDGEQGLFILACVLGAFIGIVFIGFLTTLGSETREETARNVRNAAYDARRAQVYKRLRYVEQDHIVFDPETGFETTAERPHILALIDTLLAQPTNADPGSELA